MLHNPSSLLFSDYRRRVLALLLLQPEQAYHVREIARLTGSTAGTLHKELSKLAEVGILSREPRGNQVLYRANLACPIYAELASIMRKTSGVAETLAHALAALESQIDVAFIFGSVARGAEQAGSDIDVMVIGSAGFADVVNHLYDAQTALGREINPKVFSPAEWRSGIAQQEPFLLNVQARPKIYLIGTEHDLAELIGNQP